MIHHAHTRRNDEHRRQNNHAGDNIDTQTAAAGKSNLPKSQRKRSSRPTGPLERLQPVDLTRSHNPGQRYRIITSFTDLDPSEPTNALVLTELVLMGFRSDRMSPAT